MGFFDFLRGAGKQVELKPETLKAEIAEITDNPNYEVLVDESTVTVRGMARSQDEREKVILALGNVENVEKVEDQIAIQAVATLPGTNPPQVESRFHTVQSGDTLSKIAREVYGDPTPI